MCPVSALVFILIIVILSHKMKYDNSLYCVDSNFFPRTVYNTHISKKFGQKQPVNKLNHTCFVSNLLIIC